MAQLVANLGPERESVRIVSISIDPETDTVGRLACLRPALPRAAVLAAPDRQPELGGGGAARLRQLSRRQEQPRARDVRAPVAERSLDRARRLLERRDPAAGVPRSAAVLQPVSGRARRSPVGVLVLSAMAGSRSVGGPVTDRAANPGNRRAHPNRRARGCTCAAYSVSGGPVEATVQGDVHVKSTDLACVGCHRRSGMGGAEGALVVPPLVGATLFSPVSQGAPQLGPPRSTGPGTRPAYDDAALLRAVRDGVAPLGGRSRPRCRATRSPRRTRRPSARTSASWAKARRPELATPPSGSRPSSPPAWPPRTALPCWRCCTLSRGRRTAALATRPAAARAAAGT